MTSLHARVTVAGLIHASRVTAVVRRSAGASLTVTRAFVPLNESAFPNLPAEVHVAFEIVPALPRPDPSMTVVPLPSLKEYAATRFETADWVVALWTLE